MVNSCICSKFLIRTIQSAFQAMKQEFGRHYWFAFGWKKIAFDGIDEGQFVIQYAASYAKWPKSACHLWVHLQSFAILKKNHILTYFCQSQIRSFECNYIQINRNKLIRDFFRFDWPARRIMLLLAISRRNHVQEGRRDGRKLVGRSTRLPWRQRNSQLNGWPGLAIDHKIFFHFPQNHFFEPYINPFINLK